MRGKINMICREKQTSLTSQAGLDPEMVFHGGQNKHQCLRNYISTSAFAKVKLFNGRC